jgi:hypothetical protein
MKRHVSKVASFLKVSEELGILGSDAADLTVKEILEAFLARSGNDKNLAYQRIQEFLDKLSQRSDPDYVAKVRRAKLRLEQDI